MHLLEIIFLLILLGFFFYIIWFLILESIIAFIIGTIAVIVIVYKFGKDDGFF